MVASAALLAAVGVLFAPGSGGTPAAAPRTAEFRSCIEAAGGRQAGLAACAADEAARADRALNAAYARVRARLSPADRVKLRDAERRWLVRRDTTCRRTYRAERPGQNAAALFELCMADQASARTAALRAGGWR